MPDEPQNFMTQGIYVFSCRERVKTRLKWSESDEPDSAGAEDGA